MLAYANPFMATEPRARLGAKLAELAPGDIDVFFFTNGGAEANENAIKHRARVAPAATRSWRATARTTARTAGAIALTGDPRRWAAEPGMPGHRPRARVPQVGPQRARAGRRRACASSRKSSARGAADHRGLHPRDRGRHQRHPDPARRLPAGRARALRPPRHPADRRRGDVRLRPHGRVVRGRPLEGRARHHHDGQGADVRLRASSAPWACGRSIAEHFQERRLPRRPHLQQPPAGLRRGARHDRGLRGGEA